METNRQTWPTRLHLYIGGHPAVSVSYTVALSTAKTQVVEYRMLFDTGSLEQEITPTDERWQEFWAELDRIEAWTWKENYGRQGVDGTEWNFKIEHGSRRLTSKGHNRYPRKKVFEAFLRAVKALLGGFPFE